MIEKLAQKISFSSKIMTPNTHPSLLLIGSMTTKSQFFPGQLHPQIKTSLNMSGIILIVESVCVQSNLAILKSFGQLYRKNGRIWILLISGGSTTPFLTGLGSLRQPEDIIPSINNLYKFHMLRK